MHDNNTQPLRPETREFIDRMGIRFEMDGGPRIAGQTLALMLISAAPRSLDEIAELLEVSKASASTNARLLERFGLLVRVALPGDRRDYYTAAGDLEKRILEHRLALMKDLRDVLDSGLDTPEAEHCDVRRRLAAVTAFLSDAIDDLVEAGRRTCRRTDETEDDVARRRVG